MERGLGLVVDRETLVAVIRGRDVIHGSVVAVLIQWDCSRDVSIRRGCASIDARRTFRVLVTAAAQSAAPYHLMPFPPPYHHCDDYGYDGNDNTGDFSHRKFAATVIIIVVVVGGGGIGGTGVGRVVGSLGGI